MAFSFLQQENKIVDTEYPEEVRAQIEEFKANYKAEISQEIGMAERLTNYSYVAAAYFVGKALIGITFNPTLTAISVFTIAMIPATKDLDGFKINYQNGRLEIDNMHKPFSVIAKVGGAGFLVYGVLNNYYSLKSATERTYEVIETQRKEFEGDKSPIFVPESMGLFISFLLMIAAYYFVPKRN
jgi:hypothetical protein